MSNVIDDLRDQLSKLFRSTWLLLEVRNQLVRMQNDAREQWDRGEGLYRPSLQDCELACGDEPLVEEIHGPWPAAVRAYRERASEWVRSSSRLSDFLSQTPAGLLDDKDTPMLQTWPSRLNRLLCEFRIFVDDFGEGSENTVAEHLFFTLPGKLAAYTGHPVLIPGQGFFEKGSFYDKFVQLNEFDWDVHALVIPPAERPKGSNGKLPAADVAVNSDNGKQPDDALPEHWRDKLSATELRLVRTLWGQRSKSFAALHNTVWKDKAIQDATIEKAVKRTNQKILDDGYAITIRNQSTKLENSRTNKGTNKGTTLSGFCPAEGRNL